MPDNLNDNDTPNYNPVGESIGHALRVGTTWQIIIAIIGILLSLANIFSFNILPNSQLHPLVGALQLLLGVLQLYASYRLLKSCIIARKATKNGSLDNAANALTGYGVYFKLYSIGFIISYVFFIGIMFLMRLPYF